jgi:hypothetical protein
MFATCSIGAGLHPDLLPAATWPFLRLLEGYLIRSRYLIISNTICLFWEVVVPQRHRTCSVTCIFPVSSN